MYDKQKLNPTDLLLTCLPASVTYCQNNSNVCFQLAKDEPLQMSFPQGEECIGLIQIFIYFRVCNRDEG